MRDPIISLGIMNEENGKRELEDVKALSTLQHDIEETIEEDINSLDNACEEESINLFEEMGAMGIDLDDGACKDLMEDKI